MAGQKPTQVSHKSVILWLLGLTVCYQIAYQTFMYRTLQQESLEEECAAPLLGGGLAGGLSPQCAEVQLFRSWQEADVERHAAAADAAADAEGLGPEEHLVKESAPVKHFGEMASDAHVLPLPLAAESGISGLADAAGPGKRAEASEASPRDRGLHGAIAAIAEATDAATAAAALRAHGGTAAAAGAAAPAAMAATAEAAHAEEPTAEAAAAGGAAQEGPQSPVTAWAAGLEDLQRRLQDHMDHLPRMVHKEAHERHEQMDGLMDAVAASLHGASNASAVTPWAAELVELQRHLDADMHAREAHRNERLQPSTVSTTTEMSLLDRIYRAGREMCSDPEHRHRPECAQFLGGETNGQKLARRSATAASKAIPRPDARLAELRADREVWEEAFVAKVAKTGLLRNETSGDAGDAEPRPSRTGLRGGAMYMHWSSVKAWHAPGWWEKSGGPEVVTREEAQGAHWSGMIPKVACITTISSGMHATAQMKYFINNFRLQSYEGPRQLVLVYHHNDTQAARLVQNYADGASIRGVAARSEDLLPSTSGMRYGAWVADADAIARWDFDEWHHPHRLSLQVRAMALSSRPACLLQPAGDAIGGLSREASIVGEAAWMRRHWKPLAPDEWETLAGVQAPRVVELRHAEALRHAGHGAIAPADDQTRRDTGNKTAATATAGETPPEVSRACAQLQGAGAEATEGIEDRIGTRVGEGMGETYRNLAAKGRDVKQKLRSLCVEFAAEANADRRARLGRDAEHMSAILTELDKHFAALGSLFGKDP